MLFDDELKTELNGSQEIQKLMKAQTKLNCITLSSMAFGPFIVFAGFTIAISLLRFIFGFSTDWGISMLMSIPFTLIITIMVWILCGTIFLHIDVDDHEGPRKIPTKWDQTDPKVLEIIKTAEARIEAENAAKAKNPDTSTSE